MRHFPGAVGFSLLLTGFLALPVAADPPADASKLAGELRRLDSLTFPADSAGARRLATMCPAFVQARVDAAVERQAREFEQVKTKADWQRFREPRLKALRDSLGVAMPDPKQLDVRVRDKSAGEGYRI